MAHKKFKEITDELGGMSVGEIRMIRIGEKNVSILKSKKKPKFKPSTKRRAKVIGPAPGASFQKRKKR